jgi:hypothetical protein
MMENKPVRTLLRILTFRFSREEIDSFQTQHLQLGLVFTWLVGIGRYWDNPNANWLQHLGVGSLIYVVVLSALIWVIVLPLRKNEIRYFSVLTFVTLVAPPAILYAIPVERWVSLNMARDLNVNFLAVVATWRVLLLILFLWRYLQLNIAEVIFTTLLPLSGIITLLGALNLEHAVFDIMAGIDRNSGTPYDSAYVIVLTLMVLSWIALPISIIGYAACVIRAVRKRNARISNL